MRTIAVIAGFTLFLALSSSAAGIDEKYRQQLQAPLGSPPVS